MRGIRTSRLLAATLAALALMRGTAMAQGASAPAMKAAFLYNFAKFTYWPIEALAPGQPLVLCVVGEPAVADALEQMIKQQVVDGHALTAQAIKTDGPVRACHVLYVGSLDAKRSAQLFDTLKGASVLSVGDAERFAEAGGVAQLLIERDRMRFAINVTSAQRARIVLSSKLLSLAKIVKDERDVPH